MATKLEQVSYDMSDLGTTVKLLGIYMDRLDAEVNAVKTGDDRNACFARLKFNRDLESISDNLQIVEEKLEKHSQSILDIQVEFVESGEQND